MAIIILAVALLLMAATFAVLKSRNMHLWIGSHIVGRFRRERPSDAEPIHVMFCFVDHFEPMWLTPDYATEVARVERWRKDYPALASRHLDSDGVRPQHTFFYPAEEYRPEHLDAVAEICRQGFGEIEIHLHHDADTPAGLTQSLEEFIEVLHTRHDALSIDPKTQKPTYAFIHGNWCLDNARPDGRYCGIDNELPILRETGCYADFTLPAAPDVSQTKKINSLYYATGKPGQRKAHNTGIDMQVGGSPSGDLLIMQGPLALNWRQRKAGVMPKIENADVRVGQPATPDRVDLWVDAGISVRGRPNWRFVKVHTHGTQEPSMPVLLEEPADAMYSYLEHQYNDGEKYCLHYVTAREMFNIARAAEDGHSGNPNDFRDYYLPRPQFAPPAASQ